jgi:hypothetical protein
VSIDTTANVHLEAVNGQQTVTRIDLNTTVNAPGIDNDTFQKIAEGTKQGCPISRLLAPGYRDHAHRDPGVLTPPRPANRRCRSGAGPLG